MGTKTYNNYEDLLTYTRASKGHALRPVSYGDELVTNGTFDSDISGWTDSLSTSTWDPAGYISVSYFTSASGPYQSFSTEVGKIYTVSGTLISTTGTGASGPLIRAGSGSSPDAGIIDSNTLSAGETATISFVATSTTSYVYLRNASAYTSKWDNISVKEVTFDQPDGTLTLFEHPNNIPRVEWDADGNRLGLLVEEARTNLFPYSEDFSNAAWIKQNLTVSPNTVTAPDGTNTADVCTPSSGTSDAGIRAIASSTASPHVFSVWLKSSTDSSFDVNLTVTRNVPYASVASKSVTVTTSWQLFSVSATLLDTSSHAFRIGHGSSWVDGEVLSIWGAQLEAGSFPTSYIKTTGATATRSADVASIPVADFGYNNKEGTILVEGDYKFNTSGSGFPRILELGNTTTSENRIVIYISESGNDAVFGPLAANVQQASINLFADQTDGVFEASKMAIVFAENNFIGVRDGVTKATDTSGTIVPSEPRDILAIGRQAAGSSSVGTGHFKTIKYYPRALTSAQLQALTEPRSDATLSLTFDGLESSFTENYIHG